VTTPPYDGPPKTLDFSGMSEYEKCPLLYKWNRLDRKKPSVPDNSYYAICGIVKQKLFEDFYNKEWWRKGAECAPYMEGLAESYFNATLEWAKVDWNNPIAKLSKEQLIEEVRSGVRKGIKIIKDQKLLTKDSKSEVKLTATLKNKINILGKVDFIIRHSPEKVWIIDGKDTAKPDKMPKVDHRQLLFYSLLYYENYGVYPEKVGFMFWRHDDVLYYDPKKGMDEILKWTEDTYWKVRNGKFDPKPSSSNCHFCKYKNDCEAYTREVKEGGVTFADDVTEINLF